MRKYSLLARYLLSTVGVGLVSSLFLSPTRIEAAGCVPLPPGVVGWWPGENTAADALGFNNGSNALGVSFAPGKVGQAFVFNGTNNFIQIPDSIELSSHAGSVGELTIEGWVFLPRLPQFDTATGQANRAIAIKGGPGQWEYGLYVTTNAVPVFGVWQANGSSYASASGVSISTNAWHHLAGVVRKGQFVRLYIDGQLVGETTTFSGVTTEGTSPLYIGRRGDGQYFDGMVDELAVFSRGLDATEIEAIFAAGTFGKCTTLTGAAVPYQADFENGVGPEWGQMRSDNSESIAFTRFNGQFDNGVQILTLTNLVPGQSYTVGFDLYVIDSWDGATSDYFNVAVDGNQVFHQSFGNSVTTQTFPGSPDEGRANFGFIQTSVDSIYRNIEVAFTASNSTSQLMFSGQNLTGIGDESWGLDNVSVRSSLELTNTFVRSTTLPNSGTTNYLAFESFTIAANWPLQATTATNPANYSLRLPGGDGVFGNGDDIIIPLTVSSPGAGGRAVAFAINTPPLQAGHYQFQAAGLQATNGAAVPAFTRDFYIANPIAGVLEGAGNSTVATATALPLTESPVGSGYFTTFGAGTFSAAGDVDYWRFEAEAGDLITVRLEAESQNIYSHIRIRTAADADLSGAAVDGYNTIERQNFTIATPGTYYVRVWNDNYRARYGLRLTISRVPSGPQFETEANDSQGTANALNLVFSPGLAQGRMAGTLPLADPAGDFIRLGTLNVGNAINVTTLYPTGATITASQTILSVQLEGSSTALAATNTGNFNYTVVSNGVHYLRVQTTDPDLRAQYLLNVSISDGVPPVIVGTSLPAEAGSTNSVLDRFVLNFSEDVYPLSVSNAANYDLRGMGPDNVFGTADDPIYHVVTTGYTSGLVAGFSITDGPLQAGNYRFTISTNFTDRAGNRLAAPFVRNFSIANVPGLVLETRNNDYPGLATPLSSTPGTNGNGTFSWVQSLGTPSSPRFIAKGNFNGDTNLDLVTANWGGGNISILTNTGTGQFALATNLATGANPISVAVADFNNDGVDDLVVANYSANTVTVLLGGPVGSFTVSTNLPGFSNPFDLEVGDVNGDGKPDILVPNSGAGTLSVLRGNGDGTFQAATNYATGSYAMSVAIADVNGDNKPDLAVVNYNSSTVTLLTNTGTGTFVTATNIPVGSHPRFVAISDVTGDGVADLVVLQPGENSIAVMAGNGDGTFQPRRSYLTGTTDAYHFQLADFNGDGRKDIVIAGYGNNQAPILLNNGSGVFTNIYSYAVSQNPISVVTGDFNNDGRLDAVLTHFNGDYISVWNGNAANPLLVSPVGSGLRSVVARGIRSASSDVDYYQFTGNIGDQAIIAVDVPGNPPSSGLRYALQYWDGNSLVTFDSSSTGWGQSGVVTLPKTGTYLVRVSSGSYDFQGEYRIRVTLAAPPVQLEGEDNGSIANADPVTLVRSGNHLQGAVAGYLSVGDGGDYFQLGYLLGSDVVNLTVQQPSSSGLAAILSIYNAAGGLMTNSQAGATNFSFTVPAGQDGNYYALVTAGTAGFATQTDTAIRLSGGSDYLTLGATWFSNQVFTLSMWVNPGASQNQYADILDNNHQTGVNWVIQQNVSVLNQYVWGPGDGSTNILFNLAANTWQHLTITRDATNISRVYLNGVLVGTSSGSGQINYNGSQSLNLGRWGGGGRNWNGIISDLRMWDHPLTAGEITASMSGSLTGNEPGLLGYWPFNEGFGATSADLSPAGHVATLVNNPTWLPLGPATAAGAGLQSQYLLNLDLSNAVPPQITAVSLPPEGSTSSNLISAFSVNFSEFLDPAFAKLSRSIYRFNGHSYLLTDSALSWPDAEAEAVNLGGHLVSITNATENAWLSQTFAGNGDLWIGLSQVLGREFPFWTSGDPYGYSNWNGGEPNNSGGYESGVRMYGNANGTWYDTAPSAAVRGMVEISASTDTDGDGLVDELDPYPTDALNAFDLRAAGPDNQFDTSDDVVYRIYAAGYASGTSAAFSVVDGPLQPGSYRFKVTPALRDRFGIALAAPYLRYFTNTSVSGFITENRRDPGNGSSTSLSTLPSAGGDASFAVNSTVGVGANPYFIRSADFNSDGYLDLVTANYSSGNISVLTNDHTGHFQLATNIATGGGALSVVAAQLSGDTNLDLAVANYTGGTVSILLGNGAAGFVLVTNLTGFTNPQNLAATDFNHDGVQDLVVPSYGGARVTTLCGVGNGNFTNFLNYPVNAGPQTVAVGELNGDGNPDLMVNSYNSSLLTVLLGASNGVFTVTTNFATAANPRYVALADVSGDGKLDSLAVNGGGVLSVAFGNGDGTFGARTDYSLGSGDTYQVVAADLNNDGTLDVVVPGYGSSRLITMINNGDGTFGAQLSYNFPNNPISAAVGDFNLDGTLDIATADYNGADVSVMLQNSSQLLPFDANGTGIRIAAARGNLADGSDYGYWSFSAATGEQLFIAAENPGDPGGSQLLYRIYYPNGSQWTYFYTDGNGRGNISLTIPAAGRYAIRVEQSQAYSGEYRLRVALARPSVQLESEDNSTIANANTLSYTLTNGLRTAAMLGYIGNADGNGDYYALGNLAGGTQISLDWARPANSALSPLLEIYNAAGVLMTNSRPISTNLVFVTGLTNGGAYYAHLTWTYAGRNATTTNALYLNGANNYVNLGAWSPGTNWSTEVWAMPVSLPGGRRTIIGAASSCADWGIVLQDGKFGANVRSGGCAVTYAATNLAVAGTWYHVALTCNGTNALLYVNGTLVASGPVDQNYAPYAGGTRIGSEVCCGNYFPGAISAASIWNRALSPAEVTGFYSVGPTGGEAGLVGLWNLQSGAGTTLPDLSPGGHNGTFVNSPAWIALAPPGSLPSGILQEYLLNVQLANTIPPQIVAVSLPGEGTASGSIWDRFNITFSEDMAPGSVTNSANYELRSAGGDNIFGSGDDQLYTVQNSPTYTSGTAASYLLPDGPLQPGLYRFTVKTNVSDPVGTFLPAPYLRNFAITNVPGFVFEGRFHNAYGQATSLSVIPTNLPNGGLTAGTTIGLGSGVERIAAGLLNADTNVDIVAALWQAGGVAVLTGNGDGTFTVKTNYATGTQAWSVALDKFNADTNLDLVVANYGANSIKILLGNGDGTFQIGTTYPVGTQPYHVVTADINQDGKVDVLVPNWGSANISVLLGNGDGTFQPAVNYPVGANPAYLLVADVNADGKKDLFVVNYGINKVSLLFGNGDGTFAAPVLIPTGLQPRALALADFDHDTKLDLAVFNGGDNTISVMLGNGDGSFQARTNYAASTSDGYELLAVDVDADGWTDLVVPGYNNSGLEVLLNRNGTFPAAANYSFGNRPVGLVAGDFNHDGRMDFAVGNDVGNSLGVMLGNSSQPLVLDAATGLRIGAGRGNLLDGSQSDYWSFDARAGDLLYMACENPGNPNASQLHFTIYRPDGVALMNFYPDYNGRGQAAAICPLAGTYSIRIDPYYVYTGEYRFRVTLAPPPTQVESENNDNIGSADPLSWSFAAGHRQATVLGYSGSADPGDFFQLGTLSAGASIQLQMTQPATSGLLGGISIYNSASTLVAYSPVRSSNFSFTVPPGGDGNYYAQVWDSGGVGALSFGSGNNAALKFWGSSDWISFTNAIIPAAGDFTVEAWAYATGPSSYREILSQGSGGNAFYLGTDGANVRAGDGWANTGVSFPFYGWHHFAVVKSSTNTLLYIDGSLAAAKGSTIPNPAAGNAFRIGKQYSTFAEYWPGYIDEVRIWNVARSGTEVAANFSNRLSGAESGLVGYWRFDEGSGSSVADSSSGANVGAFQGTPVWIPGGITNVQSPNIFSQYLLTLDLSDTTGPGITSVTLPGAGTTNAGIVDRFTLSFNQDVDPTLNLLNRDVRVLNGHAYTVTPGAVSWYDAEIQARALGGHLATIDDLAENGWVNTNFSAYGVLWLGLNDESQKGTYVWTSGSPFAYTNWDASQPNNANNSDYVAMRANGRWADYQINSGGIRGLIEVAGPDSDGDGIPDTIDPYPNDAYNAFDLRAAGADGQFDTPDDAIYHLSHSAYSSGTLIDFAITDGPLQPGNYRFIVTSSFRDLFGNGLGAPFTRYFTVTGVPGYVLENRSNDTPATATPLIMVEDPPLLKSGAARGNLTAGADTDYYSFVGTAGDLVKLGTFVPGYPGASQLYYRVFRPDGSQLVSFYPAYTGDGETTAYLLPTNGTYTVAVSPYYGYQDEYRIRLTTATPPLQMEAEPNDTIATASPVTFNIDTNGASASLIGRIRVTGDLDYVNLGTVTNGSSIFLNVRTPGSSSLVPIVSVYNAAGTYQTETIGGRANDGVANVPITVTGTYYALVRASGGSVSGLDEQYVLDVNVVPTGSVNFPNLVVTTVNPPTGSSILSGQNIVYSFDVANVGNVATAVGNWTDRAVLSTDPILGNGDDIPMGFFPHVGTLGVTSSYSVTNPFVLPEGIAGDYYVIVQTDSGNAVNEYLFKGDNVTVSSNTFHVNIAPYPDLTVENLSVSGPDGNSMYSITWNTANRGTAPAPAGFYERYIVRNLTSGALLYNVESQVTNILATNAVLARLQTLVATNSGTYQIQIITDSRDSVFEYGGGSHATAELNNSATNGFQIIAYFNITVQSAPPAAGLLTGGGAYASGATATVTATPITNTLPYLFVNWTEGGAFQSSSTNYPFVVSRDRTLTANFTLPTYTIAASNNPPTAGVVSGQGSYFYGVTNVLTATAGLGYRFTNWTENGLLIGQLPSLTNIITSNRLVVANYVEANTYHVVTTASSPTNIAVVTGAGTYTNGQVVNFTAPASVTNPPNIYNFKQYLANGSLAGNSASFSKTFSTLDPTNLQYVAVYDTVSILPLVTNVTRNLANVVPATTNFVLTFQFNRSMNTNVAPLVVLTNPTAVAQAVVPAGGNWASTAVSNDTFATLPITFSTGMDGTNAVWLSQAQDLSGGAVATTNLLSFVVDVTPPANPVLTLSASNSSTATVNWSGYVAPADLGLFRVYLATNNFTSVTGLTAVVSLSSGARSYTYGGLVLDRQYYAAVTAVDAAGNSSPQITPLAFSLPSSVPPPVSLQVTAAGSASALVAWNSYNTSALLGFAGFQLYYETTNFTSVAGLTARQNLNPATHSVQVDGLDRTKTYYFAVVGYNVNNAINPNVATAAWSDPYAGQIGVSSTIGGAGQTIDILQSITLVSNAVLTIPPGTTLRFAAGAGLTVQQGALNANGTALDPIVFTSANDQSGLTASAGDWNGIVLGNGAGGSILRHLFIKYGAGLSISNAGSPTVDALTAQFNTPAGLTVAGTTVLNTTNALIAVNDVGARQFGAAQLNLRNSVIKNNGTNALASGGGAMQAEQNWWGTTVPATIDGSLQGAVTHTIVLAGEPLLTPAIGTSNNITQVGSPSVDLRLACRTAETMRLSEDSTFTAVFFNTFSNLSSFPLSSGGGLKTIFAQFRSVTGETSAPVSITVTYITAGPTIATFSLSEGALLTRPLNVTGSASAPLGMAAMEFYLDNVGIATNAGGNFSYRLDVRTFSIGTHRAKLVARDNSGNLATRELNVVIAPTPPPAPVIVLPATDLVINTNGLRVTGTAEPFVQVSLLRSSLLAGTTNAAADGSFAFPAVVLNEGPNQLTAQAADVIGTASSPVRQVTLDTVAPAQLILDPPTYQPGVGLTLSWHFPVTGKHATAFRVFWSTVPISNPANATGSTLLLNNASTLLQGLATTNYYFYVVGYDAIGNQSPLSAAVSFAYDAVPPGFALSFNKPSPVGVGPLHLVLTASEPLGAMPTLTIQPNNLAPSLVTLSNTAVNTYEADVNISTILPSGAVQFRVTGIDLAGNTFSGAPVGPALVIDVTPPAAYLSTSLVPPIQTTNTTNITVSLQLTEVPQTGSTPTLNFTPPIGAAVPVALTGAGTNWSGPLTLTSAMGSGIGHFTLTVLDNLGNVGHSLLTGSALELYNTALPTPPAQPVNFFASPTALGRIQLTWSAVENAEMYRVYSETGTTFTVPTFLVADNILTNRYLDLPPVDGYYRYVVTASRRGAEGPVSIVRVALSDRTPPPAPTNVVAQLAASGLQISWQAGTGATPDHYNVYRNGALIRTTTTVAPVLDNPPRGIMTYTVGAVDTLGNEALSDPVNFQLLVGAVNNLQVVVDVGQSPVLTWASTDGTAVGFNLYRNGIKQNSQVISNTTFADALPIGSDPVIYAITAVNATNAESAVRSVTVYPLDVTLLVNSADGVTPGLPSSSYFDRYQTYVSNLTASVAFPLAQVEVQRTLPGSPALNSIDAANTTIGVGNWYASTLAVPCATNSANQTVLVSAVQQSDVAGGSVRYRRSYNLGGSQSTAGTVEISANELPLAGGLTPFSVKVYNRGLTPIYLATTRGNGAQPGDVFISVKNPQGQEVSRTPFSGTPPGTTFYGDTGYLMIPGGGSTTFTVPAVLVPEALASNVVTFQAVVSAIYDRGSATGQQVSGPLSGSTQSSLTQTPYYGTAQTDFPLYSNNQPIIITGQARDRLTNLPVPNAALKIGFATRGYRWYSTVTTDANGNYSYTYNVTPGLAGTLSIWAAHPLVFDQLNQAEVSIYRIYATPQGGDIRMSINNTLPFTISVLNPGDQPLTSFHLDFSAYRMSGTNQIPITSLHGALLSTTNFNVAPGQRQNVTLQLTADVDAPTNAVALFTLASAEGAAAVFTGFVTLTPAVPVLSVTQPDIGYVEVSMNRGSLLSRQVTVVNRGLQPLRGVWIQPPTNYTWMTLNLPTNPDGTIPLPDIEVGQSNSFTVVFTPPTNHALGFFQDKFTIRGTNSASVFDVNLYARVTSANHGSVQFYVDNILGLDVPNATVRLRNLDLQVELPAVLTDINGLVTVTNLQEGDWSWQIGAPGHSANVGVVNVIAEQTVSVATRLNRSVVTVNFTVVPVPYTDRYEIQLEQTFETHVPLPVLVLTPSFRQFDNVTPGFQASYIVTAKNEGLIQMENLTITGQTTASSSYLPLITYVPYLLPQQTIEIPFTVTYYGTNGPTQQGLGGALAGCLPDPSSIGSDIPAFIDGLRAIANAEGRCIKDNTLLAIAGGVAIGMKLYQDITGLFAPIAEQIASYIGCVIGTLLGEGLGGGGAGYGGQGSGQGFQNGGAGCFAADTSILLADGRLKRIDEVVAGDVVQSGIGSRDVAVVANSYRFQVTSSREISFRRTGQSKVETLITTAEHMFWVDGKGWSPAGQLKAGDWLLTSGGGRAQIETAKVLAGPREVFTLKLRDDTAFYANGVLVHDLCGGWAPPEVVQSPWLPNLTNSIQLNLSK